jgi:uncharacterized UPF0160 family protein
MFSKATKICVHDGTFHADDVFAVAALSIYSKGNIKIFRSRDPKVWDECDYVCDVGRVYDPAKKRFDHHQETFKEQRQNGIRYAAAGLVWKEFGEKICGSSEIAKRVDESLIQAVDAEDNGQELFTPIFKDVNPYTISDLVADFNPTWKEDVSSGMMSFQYLVSVAKRILERSIKDAEDEISGEEHIKKIYNETEDKRLLILDGEYSWQHFVSHLPEPLIVVKPIYSNNTWYARAVPVEGHKYDIRIHFPESWAGKEGEELQKVTGVSDAKFCHKGRFLCFAYSKEGAIALAKLALK